MNNRMNAKRVNPPFYQHDFHVLRRLVKLIKETASRLPDSNITVDYGCGTSPYENIFRKGESRYIKVDIGKNPQADIKISENMKLPLKSNFADIVLSTQV